MHYESVYVESYKSETENRATVLTLDYISEAYGHSFLHHGLVSHDSIIHLLRLPIFVLSGDIAIPKAL